VGPSTGLDGCGKFLPHRDFFLLLSFYTSSLLVLCRHCTAFCLLSLLYDTHNGQISLPPAGFIFVLCTLSVLLYPDCPGFAFFCYCITHTTQTSMPLPEFEPVTSASDRPQTLALDRSATGIRTRSPSKRSVADPRLRPLGHWDSIPRPSSP
jgi:hypothetical protein